MMNREAIHRLIDSLSERKLQAAARFLEYLSMSGDVESLDEEPFSPEEMAALDESWQQFKRGEVLSFHDVVQSLDPGFSLDS